MQLGDREFAAIGEEAFVPPVDTSTKGVFLVEELALPAWKLSFGGRVEAHSEGSGHGSEFIVTLPAVVDRHALKPPGSVLQAMG